MDDLKGFPETEPSLIKDRDEALKLAIARHTSIQLDDIVEQLSAIRIYALITAAILVALYIGYILGD